MNDAPVINTCVLCGREHERKRSPRKGYKMTSAGAYCDDPCFNLAFETRVYEFGCGSPRYGGYDGPQTAIAEMRTMNRLRNAIVEINGGRDAAYLRLTTDPEIEARLKPLDEELTGIDAGIREQMKLQRTKRPKIEDAVRERRIRLRSERKILRGELSARRKAMKETNRDAVAQLYVDTKQKIAEACKAAGLNWTNVFAVMEDAARATNFKRFDGRGRIHIPYTNGLPVKDAYREDEAGKFQIATRKMTSHPREKRTLVRIAITMREKSQVWLTLPVVFHQPLPAGASIQEVDALHESIAGQSRWKLCITVRQPRKPANAAPRPTVGIDLGWRKRVDGIRVAYWMAASGDRGELLLPQSIVDQFRLLDDLRSIIDKHFNSARDRLIPLLRAADLPDAVREACSGKDRETGKLTFSVHQWKSPARLFRLLRTIEANRFDGDSEIHAELYRWYDGERPKPSKWNGHRHLYQYWSHLSNQVIRHRREIFRVFAARLVRDYGAIVLEDFDLTDVIEHPDPIAEADSKVVSQQNTLARWYRRIAAAGSLRLAIVNAAGRESVPLHKIGAEYTTRRCPDCGADNPGFDAAAHLSYVCDGCGKLWDQDHAAALNLLRLFEWPPDLEKAGATRVAV